MTTLDYDASWPPQQRAVLTNSLLASKPRMDAELDDQGLCG